MCSPPGEVIPQAVCSRYGLMIGAYSAWFVRLLMTLVLPISWPIAKLLDFLLGADHSVKDPAFLVIMLIFSILSSIIPFILLHVFLRLCSAEANSRHSSMFMAPPPDSAAPSLRRRPTSSRAPWT